MDADGEVRQCLEVLAGSSGGGGEIVGPNIAALWEGLQNAAALQDLPQEVGEMARGAVARVLQRGCSNSMQA